MFKPDYEIAPPPVEMCKEAKKFYREVGPILKGYGLLEKSDMRAFHKMCELEGLYQELFRDTKKEGIVISADQRNKYTNPSFTALKVVIHQLTQFYTLFGLHPTARLELDKIQKKKNEPDIIENIFSIDE